MERGVVMKIFTREVGVKSSFSGTIIEVLGQFINQTLLVTQASHLFS